MSKAKAIRRRLIDGASYKQIVNELKVAKSTISYHAKQLGMRRRTFARVTHDWVAIQKLVDKLFLTRAELAKWFQLDRSAIRDAVERGDLVFLSNSPVRPLLALARSKGFAITADDVRRRFGDAPLTSEIVLHALAAVAMEVDANTPDAELDAFLFGDHAAR